MKMLYPLTNNSSRLQIECSLLMYTTIIRPYWAPASQIKIKKLQTTQNKFLRIALKAPWSTRKTLNSTMTLQYHT